MRTTPASPPVPGNEPVASTEPLADYLPEFDTFYRDTYPAVVAVAHSMTGDRHLGEEIAQEAFIAAHRRWGKVRRLDRPDLWVRRVAINRCSSTWRRKLIERRANSRVVAGLASTSDATVESGAQHDALWKAVRGLPDRQRAAVVLHYIDGRSTAEIGELLGCSASTVQTHLTRARQRLAEILAPPRPDPTKGAQP